MHPHLHILTASGLFDSQGRFHLLPAPSAESLDALTELFRQRFIQTLVSHKLLGEKRARDLLGWKHSGFNLDAGEKAVAADDVDGRRRLAEYLLRAPFSLQKITWKEETSTVIYPPDFESQESQPAGDSPETSRAWEAREITLDDDRILVLDADPPAQEEFPEFFHD